MDTYHISIAVAHWTSHPSLQGERTYHYRYVAWLLALALHLSRGPFAGQLRGHVACSRLLLGLPRLTIAKNRGIAKFWKDLGAVKIHGRDSRGTDYEIVIPDRSELSEELRGVLDSALAVDYLVPRETLREDVREREKKEVAEPVAVQQPSHAETLARLLPGIKAHARRREVAAMLCEAAGLRRGSIRYAPNHKTGARADEVEHTLEYLAESGWSWAQYVRVCKFVAADEAAPADARWLFSPRHRAYLASVVSRLEEDGTASGEVSEAAEVSVSVPEVVVEERPRLWQRLRALGVQGLRAGDLEGVIEQRFGGEDQAHAELDAYLAAEDRSVHPLHELLASEVHA
jgi:hypothetical protein